MHRSLILIAIFVCLALASATDEKKGDDLQPAAGHYFGIGHGFGYGRGFYPGFYGHGHGFGHGFYGGYGHGFYG